jgi:4-hydroxy-4-methyl-2-oxoglutarate aldolase
MTPEQRTVVLNAYEDLRVADVRDALDVLGHHSVGSMNQSIRPLWRTRAFGLAQTARYLRYTGPIPQMTPEKYAAWTGWYYNNVCTYPWTKEILPGNFIVIDAGGVDAGLIGSENGLACLRAGARGILTSGGVRDTDELILTNVPVWTALISQSMVQGRLQYEGRNTPITVGGVTVTPEDMIVADGDGVIVVPQSLALDVARYAHEEHNRDKKARKAHYQALHRQPDATVE